MKYTRIWQTKEERMSAAAAAAQSLQSCPSLCDPTDGSPPGSPIPGILQARTLEWVSISFSNCPLVWTFRMPVSLCSKAFKLGFSSMWTEKFQMYSQIYKRQRKQDQFAGISWITEKARKFHKNIYFCFIDYTKAFNCVGHNKLKKPFFSFLKN